MLRFLHTADWHLGSPQHPKIYREQLLPKFAEFLEKNELDLVLCVGDVFDQHNPDQRIKDELLEFLINSKAHFLFVVGNHDFADKTRTYHSLQYLKLLEGRLDNVFVYDKSGVYTIAAGPKSMTLLVVVDDKWEAVQNYPLDSKVDLVAWHGTVPGISFDKGVSYTKNSALESFIKRSGCKYFALGDIHKHMALTPNCRYSGALVQKTYGCESGMWIVSLVQDSFHAKSCKLGLPEKVNVPITFEVGKHAERSIIDFIKEKYSPNSLLRVIFNLPLDIWASLNKDLIKKELVEFNDIKLDNIVRVPEKRRANIEAIKQCKTLDDELKMMIDSEKLDIDKVELFKVCKELSQCD